jgi:ABC-type multidrug transport system permease subunit
MLLVTLFESCTILLFSVLVFGVPLRGSFVDLGLLCVLTTLTFSALGLLLAARVQTIEAVSGLMNVVIMPMWIVSGVFYSAERFPDFLQPVIRYLPLTASVDALRANMLQGTSLAQIWPQLAILAVWMIASFSLALRLFRWR